MTRAGGQQREFLLDVSRLVWRAWRGQLPTGIDRVCLAYLEHFGSRSRAVIQRGGFYFVLPAEHSDQLFDLLRAEQRSRRLKLLRLSARVRPEWLQPSIEPGMIYLNVGHTGLHEASLPRWVARHRLRAVYLIHDLIPITHAQFCRAGEAEKHRLRMRNALVSAAGIIGNSQATLDDLAAFAAAEKLRMPSVLPAWISGGAFHAEDVPDTPLPPKPYFITVGTIEGRKNHQMLLIVWRRLVRELGKSAPSLVIVGQRGWRAEAVTGQLDNLGDLEDHVQELHACSDERLAGLIANARGLLMPSLAEGFGLPIIEALELGTPVIASDLPVFREIAGNIPLYLDPLDSHAWERAISAFIGDADERSRQVALVADFRAPSWEDHFHKVEAWLASS